MPSFLIRGLARYIAASAMERRASRSSHSYTHNSIYVNDFSELSEADLSSWSTDMRWLIPFVKVTGLRIVIENPKSHERIIIDQNTKELPELTLEWMQNYDKQELLDWMAQEKERDLQEQEHKEKLKKAHSIAEARGRAKFGNSYKPTEKDIQDALNNYMEEENIQDNLSNYK